MPIRYLKSLSAGIKPDPKMDYATWANNYFYLPKESSAEYGRFRVDRTPFIKEPLEALSPDSSAETIVLIKPTQQGGTTIGLIFQCGMIDMYPGPALMIMPTDSMAKSYSKKKLAAAIRATPRLKGKIKETKGRDSKNTILQKEFPGGSIMLSGSNSGASYRSESIKYLILDDFDGFAVDIEGEGDPKTLADRRTGTFPDRKVFINSTTTRKETSNIERAFDASSQGFFQVPCPRCGKYQYLRWGGRTANHGIKFNRDQNGVVNDVWYQCEHCQGRIEEHEKQTMSENGKYVHRYPERLKIRGFRYNALICPVGWVNSWRYIVEENLIAVKELREGNPQKYITWLNTLMSEAYEEQGDQPEWHSLKARCEPYEPLTVPMAAKILTSGTDVQHNRLVVSVFGWGPNEESWLIYHIEIAGDPLHSDVWAQHDQLIYRPWRHASGIDLKICSAGVDAADGNTTQAVRNYCRFRGPVVFALIGQPGNKPIIGLPKKQDITWQGQKIDGGVEIWPIGVDTGKSTIYARLKVNQPGPGRIHHYIGIDDEYFHQLTAEKIVTRFHNGFPVREWHNVRGNKRNEALDCATYSLAAAVRAGVSYINFDTVLSSNKKIKAKPEPEKPGGWLSGAGFGGKGFLK